MTERLQKILSARAVASRRAAEEMIEAGRVSVNGVTACLGTSADPDQDEILLDGKPIPKQQDFMYIMLHKPRGYVTTMSDEKGRPTVAQLVEDCGCRVYPVGRLDYDSEGLLILTNDGDFANRMMHPRHEVSKTYAVWVKGYHAAAAALLARPITLDGYPIRKPEVKLAWTEGDKAKFFVTIHEGRNRQVRRMCQAAGMTVTRLSRVSEGCLQLGRLPKGKWRHLTEEERAGLK
ncbi:MAG: rRNA pseudouridine synthase [Oscillospiraceae bacterium]|nr:rRNA pseudouridine synthase [Oscillospiraceae bacterium]